jgi:hypothetical protein
MVTLLLASGSTAQHRWIHVSDVMLMAGLCERNGSVIHCHWTATPT